MVCAWLDQEAATDYMNGSRFWRETFNR